MISRIRISKVLAIALSIFAVNAVDKAAVAQSFQAKFQGRDVVVHQNPLPVILHRLVPPNHGRHITAKEFQQGKAGGIPVAPRIGVSRSRGR